MGETQESEKNPYDEHDEMLRAAMRSWGIKSGHVAQRTGYTVSYIGYVLRGERRNIAIKHEVVKMIAERKAEYDKIQAELEQLVDGPMG